MAATEDTTPLPAATAAAVQDTQPRTPHTPPQAEAPWDHIPTEDELARGASVAYVRSLLESLRRQDDFAAEMTARIDRLTRERRDEHDALRATVHEQGSTIDALRQRLVQAALQLQEERERSARLLHENTVLYVQDAEQRERLAGLERCCRLRGRRLQELIQHEKTGTSRDGQRTSTALTGKKSRKTGGGRLCSSAMNNNSDNNKCFTEHEEDDGPSASLSIRVATRNALSRLDPNGLPFSCGGAVSGESGAVHKASETFLRAAAPAMKDAAYPAAATLQEAKNTESEEEKDEEDEEDVDVARALIPRPATTAAHILALTEEVQTLRELLDEQRRLYEEARHDRAQEDGQRSEAHEAAREACATRIAHLEQLHECSLRDLVHYRHQSERELRALRARVDWLQRSLQEALLVAEHATRRPPEAATAMLEKWLAAHYRPHVRRLQSALVERRCTSVQAARTHEAALQDKQREINALRASVEEQRAQRRRAEARHRLEMTGVRSELDQMRQTMRQLEKKVYFARLRESAEEAMLAMPPCDCD